MRCDASYLAAMSSQSLLFRLRERIDIRMQEQVADAKTDFHL